MDSFAQRLCSAADAGDALVVRKLLRRLPAIDVNSCGGEMHGHCALSKAAKSLSFMIVYACLHYGHCSAFQHLF